ncbi:unnamed protein product [Trichogramma brassicae]|uniref:Reverse transcriptase domain-containing protein n=1 Tax=Trichogramma brassicae TaxID=86971 RepID=A0A6H5J7U3_9HYME|nr:unnamed protein product [Trichogramma brassicae]
MRIFRVCWASLLRSAECTWRWKTTRSQKTRPVHAGVPRAATCPRPATPASLTTSPLSVQVELALYADDAAYYAASMSPLHAAKKLQRTLDALPDWLSKWRFGEPVPWRQAIVYLGVTIDRRLKMTKHVDGVVAKAKLARGKLHGVLSSRLPLRMKLGIYKTYVRSRLTYAAPAWYAYCSEANKRRLRSSRKTRVSEQSSGPYAT